MSLRRRRYKISHQNKLEVVLPRKKKMILMVGAGVLVPRGVLGPVSHGAQGRRKQPKDIAVVCSHPHRLS